MYWIRYILDASGESASKVNEPGSVIRLRTFQRVGSTTRNLLDEPSGPVVDSSTSVRPSRERPCPASPPFPINAVPHEPGSVIVPYTSVPAV